MYFSCHVINIITSPLNFFFCRTLKVSQLHLFISYYVLRQVLSLLQSNFSSECNSVFLFSNFRIFSFSLRPFTSFLHLLHCLPVPSIFPFITCFRRKFLRNMWSIQLAFLRFITYRMLLSFSTLCNISSFFMWLVQMIPFILLKHHVSKVSRHFLSFFRNVVVQYHK